ncbi:hypothetical protein [Flavobacterium panacagri]|uniref:hypothetical protein n=1 Tax=Flavobacterium panacagri TaxID=3034146 RepID=UPI0025A5A161|nr:hypothetical protein [Flavobacterium panacagri]
MNNLKSFSLFTITSFILAFIMAKCTLQFRYIEEWRWLYHIGWVSCWAFHIISLVLSSLFLIFVLKKDFNLKVKHQYIWVAFGLCPLLFWIIIAGLITI